MENWMLRDQKKSSSSKSIVRSCEEIKSIEQEILQVTDIWSDSIRIGAVEKVHEIALSHSFFSG